MTPQAAENPYSHAKAGSSKEASGPEDPTEGIRRHYKEWWKASQCEHLSK